MCLHSGAHAHAQTGSARCQYAVAHAHALQAHLRMNSWPLKKPARGRMRVYAAARQWQPRGEAGRPSHAVLQMHSCEGCMQALDGAAPAACSCTAGSGLVGSLLGENVGSPGKLVLLMDASAICQAAGGPKEFFSLSQSRAWKHVLDLALGSSAQHFPAGRPPRAVAGHGREEVPGHGSSPCWSRLELAHHSSR